MSTRVDCHVFVDGVRAADGCIDQPLDAPTILEDLSVTWGRSDTMSQPPPDTCTFSVMDPVGGNAFTGLYRTGRRVDVIAHGEAFPEPSVPTFVNPGFETAAVTWSAQNATAARSSVRVKSGTQALQVKAATGLAGTLWLAPGVFQAAGTNPDAWDSIPTTSNGQTWSATVSVWLPLGASVSIDVALFNGPYSTAGVSIGSPESVVGDAAWHTLTIERLIHIDDRWVGLSLVVNPTGAAWDEMPPALTWNGVNASWSWDDMGALYVDDVQVTSPEAGSGKSVLVFSGRITDMSASWDTSTNGPVAEITAGGFTADLDNRRVGDTPWPVESVDVRAHRILSLTGLPIAIDIDTSIDEILLSWRDVDSQGATGLLQEIATSVDGVLWPAVHASLGAYLRLEDPSLRAPLLQLTLSGGLIVIVQSDPDLGYDLTACFVLRDPVTWIQNVSDLITRASVQWKVQGVDEDGLPTTSDATEYVIDAALEAQYGTRGASISTELQSATDAQDVAQRVLSRATPSGWRASGLTIDDDDVTGDSAGIVLMLDLLDGTSRIGAPIVLGDLPSWAPTGASTGVYLEGGTYRYIGGRWVLELTVSVATGLGISASWDEIDPSWTWNMWSPNISWNDLRGVAS